MRKFTNITNGEKHSVYRKLNQFNALVRNNKAIAVLEKILWNDFKSLQEKVSSQKPFGLRTYARPSETGDLVLRWNGGKGPLRIPQ